MVNILKIKPMVIDGKTLIRSQSEKATKEFQSTCSHLDTEWFDEYISKTGKFTGWKAKFCVVCHKLLDKKKKQYFFLKGNPLG